MLGYFKKHINRIHERALGIVFQDHNPTFEELLVKNGSFKIHDRNLVRLLIEIFKVKMKLAPEIMNEVFDITESPYPLIHALRFKSRNICTVRYGIETGAFVGSMICICPCKLCKIYLQRIGYLQVTN